ncbi:hypothetical protein QMM42_10600 [Leptospira santarosai]|uniref:Alpha/beta hydrolase n=1 Tax=Leptospira santarosai serovar Arenal str. MAVJ 401 TaxID=1049976 RepID=M6JF12_9LEPT|nr:hypothetical protein [Leptospira santarosai]EMM78846.1 hypothetical protein LEP1GSC040_2237 [Leptospira santarosai str. 2000030832]EMN20226.1 hypothetical protein LEP1GSC063_2516 [Leptospira santarosai serovar Arenal str. MAVJ 401]EPG82978.1 hypothetical protein LEP1GSC048_3336 [Leptospira santarosai serovar Shermani str. 1342KT]MDI7186648.1 hypothetical protein [Leptospira santarosai]MDI7190567.1 hypothetical protein [Leptospira santarosai]
MPIVRFETKSANPLVLIPEPKFSGRTLYAEVFLSSFSVRVFELSTNSMRIKFPKFEECIDLLSKEILGSKQKVTLVGEGLFSGMVFELLKKCPQAIEAACILDPPLSRNEENFFRLPKNVEWILERFPRFLFSKELHSFYECLERNFQYGFANCDRLPAIVFTKNSGKITKQIQTFGNKIERFPIFRIETSDSKSAQTLLKNLIVKIL